MMAKALVLLLLVAMTSNSFADPRLQDLDLDGPNINEPKPGPHPAVVTLHMRSVDGRPLKIDLATSTAMHHGRRGGAWRSATTLEQLCTTPCSAVVPWGYSFFQISDVAAKLDFKLDGEWLDGDATLDIRYISHQAERQGLKHHIIVGGTIGAVVGYATSALIFSLANNQHSHFYTFDPLAALAGGFYGSIIGGILTIGNEFDDRITTTVTPDH